MLKSLSLHGNCLKWKVLNTFQGLPDTLQAEAVAVCHLFIFHLHAGHLADWCLVHTYTKVRLPWITPALRCGDDTQSM